MVGWPLPIHRLFLSLECKVAVQLYHGLAGVHGFRTVSLNLVILLRGQANGNHTKQYRKFHGSVCIVLYKSNRQQFRRWINNALVGNATAEINISGTTLYFALETCDTVRRIDFSDIPPRVANKTNAKRQ